MISSSNLKAASAFACQEICQKHKECVAFTYQSFQDNCYLKTKKSGRTIESGFVSGDKFCGMLNM